MTRMPALFVGHGSPMNAIEDNGFTRTWKDLGATLPKPRAVLSVSAHWFIDDTEVCFADPPRTIHDFYGFPEELYGVSYPAPGNTVVAQKALSLLAATPDRSWGLDHGTWSVLRWLFPQADIPVFQVSIDARADMADHYDRGRRLAALRDEGVLIFGSGNVVHNLSLVDPSVKGGYGWADEFDHFISNAAVTGNHDDVIGYRRVGTAADLAVPFPDHFAPLLFALGASDPSDSIDVFNEVRTMGSLSMTGFLFS